MKLMIFSVLDVKAAAYLPPFFLRNENEARRVFGDACNDANHQFGRHPEDYICYRVGIWDDAVGAVAPDQVHSLVAKGVELLRHKPVPLFPDDKLSTRDKFEQECG